MISETKSSSGNEEIYLYRMAQTYVFAGIFFISRAVEKYIEANYQQPSWLADFWIVFVIICVVGMIIPLSKALRVEGQCNGRDFMFGKFNDEYMNHIHLQSFKVSGNLMIIFLIFSFTIFNSNANFESPISAIAAVSVGQFSFLSLGLLLLSFSIPILYMLRGDDE
ncbi:MAG: hypothetical protein HRU25_16080 [Psychrobium sp.]|nr:hypothetical protein [Psychrobium sp.]